MYVLMIIVVSTVSGRTLDLLETTYTSYAQCRAAEAAWKEMRKQGVEYRVQACEARP